MQDFKHGEDKQDTMLMTGNCLISKIYKLMKTDSVYKKEKEYLNEHIFFGLGNLNNGFDVPSIGYFSETDFEIVLDRVKQNGLGIHGIEPWQNGEYYDVRTCPLGIEPTDANWYLKAFQEFKERGEILEYAASYYIPESLLV